MSPLVITMIVLGITLALFISGRVPFAVISMFIVITLLLSNVLTPAEAFSGFTNTNVIMIAAMFVISAGLTKTSVLDRIQALVVRYKDRPRLCVFALGCGAVVLSVITSAAAATAIIIPLVVAISAEVGISRSKLLYPASIMANLAVGATFLGQGASNMTWSDVMINAGGQMPFTIWSFTLARIPVIIAGFLYIVFVAFRLLPDIPIEQFDVQVQKKDTSTQLSPAKEKIAIAIILFTIGAIILYNQINIPMFVSACIGSTLLVVFGVLKDTEALSAIHLPTMFLFAGVLPLSDALGSTGAGDMVAEWIIKLLGNTSNPYVIMAVFFLIPLIMTQFMSNVAMVAIFVPLVSSAAVGIGVDPRAAVMGVIIASSTSILTPMASPNQALIMGPGGYTLKDYVKCGMPLVIAVTIISIITLPIMFPF